MKDSLHMKQIPTPVPAEAARQSIDEGEIMILYIGGVKKWCKITLPNGFNGAMMLQYCKIADRP